MLIWFAVCATLMVAIVFRSPANDYRFVMLGAVLPLAEGLIGGPLVLHSVVGAMAILVVIMVATPKRRILRRRLLGIPIGIMCHLVLDLSFALTAVFWWPLGGLGRPSGQIPELDHLGLSIVLELIGWVVAWWAWRAFGLGDAARRQRFLDDGRLEFVDA